MGHFARDCRANKKVEETINLALDDATNESILLMAQNEDVKAKEHGGAKDNGGSREEVKAIENKVICSGFGKIAISETRNLRRMNNWITESLSSKRESFNGEKGNLRKKEKRG